MEVQKNIDLDAFRLRNTGTTKIQLEQGTEELDPMAPKEPDDTKPEEVEPLSRIIHDLSEQFGADFTEQDKVFIQHLDAPLRRSSRTGSQHQVNPPEDARLTFNQMVKDRFQEILVSNFKFYRQFTDNADLAKELLACMFERYWKAKG